MSDNATIRPSRCKTCQHWDKRFPENQQLGVCKRMDITNWGKRAHVTVTTNQGGPIHTDFENATTLDRFGCVLHSDYFFTQMEGTV